MFMTTCQNCTDIQACENGAPCTGYDDEDEED